MAAMDAESIDAIVTDPPYGLSFMGKNGTARRDHRSRQQGRGRRPTGPRASVPVRDDAGLAEAWAREALRIAKPGAHLLAFGGTRTVHRLAAAIEDAGWEIRDMLVWGYASGFPKSLQPRRRSGTAGAPPSKPRVGANRHGPQAVARHRRGQRPAPRHRRAQHRRVRGSGHPTQTAMTSSNPGKLARPSPRRYGAACMQTFSTALARQRHPHRPHLRRRHGRRSGRGRAAAPCPGSLHCEHRGPHTAVGITPTGSRTTARSRSLRRLRHVLPLLPHPQECAVRAGAGAAGR